MKLILATAIFAASFMFINLALAQDQAPMQVTTADPLVVSAVTNGGISGWIALHGGFQAAILLLVFSAFAFLSAVREVAYKYDGVEKGQPIPPQYVGLSKINVAWLVVGKVLDFLQGNVAH